MKKNQTTVVLGLLAGAGLVFTIMIPHVVIFLIFREFMTRAFYFLLILSNTFLLLFFGILLWKKIKLGRFFHREFITVIIVWTVMYFIALIMMLIRFSR